MIADTPKEHIEKAALAVLGSVPEFTLEHPGDLVHGDYSTNVAMVGAKAAGKNPRALAEEIVAALGEIEAVEKIEIAGPGFINFHLKRDFFVKATQEILDTGESWGKNNTQAGQKVMCEYTDPNPFKAFHIGHLMSNAIGESISRLQEFTSAEVKRANYQGDVGRHVACAIWGLRQMGEEPEDSEQMGRAYTMGAQAYKEGGEAKDEIVAINKALYARSDEKLNHIYDTGREKSLASFEKLYELLGTKFDYYFFESKTGPFGKALVEGNIEKGVFEESEGAIVYKGEKDGLHTRVFINSEGLPTYEAKELGLAKLKCDQYPYDRSIVITASEINEYFKVLLSVMRHIWPELAEKTTHIGHGMMQLATGKMSSSKGNIITGESLLHEMQANALEKVAERDLDDEEKRAVADAAAVGAIKYSVLRQSTGKNIVFDPEASLSFEGDSGPYLQYSHTRACSIMRKAKSEGLVADTHISTSDVQTVERLLYRFSEVVERSQAEYEPHYVATYLTELAGEFNAWYAKEQIVKSDDETSPYKVALTQAFRITMKNGLWLLGIKAPERM